MTFAEALRSVFDKWLTFSGRAGRAEFWWFVLFWALTWTTLALVSALSLPGLPVPLPMIFALATALPFAAVTFRRVQDTGRNGWLSLLWVVGAAAASLGRLAQVPDLVFVGTAAEIGVVLVILAWCTGEGTRGPNAYGPEPERRG